MKRFRPNFEGVFDLAADIGIRGRALVGLDDGQFWFSFEGGNLEGKLLFSFRYELFDVHVGNTTTKLG